MVVLSNSISVWSFSRLPVSFSRVRFLYGRSLDYCGRSLDYRDRSLESDFCMVVLLNPIHTWSLRDFVFTHWCSLSFNSHKATSSLPFHNVCSLDFHLYMVVPSHPIYIWLFSRLLFIHGHFIAPDSHIIVLLLPPYTLLFFPFHSPYGHLMINSSLQSLFSRFRPTSGCSLDFFLNMVIFLFPLCMVPMGFPSRFMREKFQAVFHLP